MTTVHRTAVNFYLQPDRPVAELLPYCLQDQDLFRGNVPQAVDWLRAWSACKQASSFAGAEAYYATEDYAWGRQCSVRAKSVAAKERILRFAVVITSILQVTYASTAPRFLLQFLEMRNEKTLIKISNWVVQRIVSQQLRLEKDDPGHAVGFAG